MILYQGNITDGGLTTLSEKQLCEEVTLPSAFHLHIICKKRKEVHAELLQAQYYLQEEKATSL